MRIRNAFVGLVIAAALAASAHAQTAVTQSLNNVTNRAATYSATHNYTLASTPDIIAMLSGSATKTVYVKRVEVSCVKTSGGYANIAVRRTSTAIAAGTAVTPTPISLDSTNSTATAVFKAYTAEPTGNLGVSIAQQYVAFPAPATLTDSKGISLLFSSEMDQHLVLRGVAQTMTLGATGQTLTGAVCSVTVRWMEQ